MSDGSARGYFLREIMEFIVTYEQCQEHINDALVCRRCGGELSPLETVDNSGRPTHWQGCKACLVFENGVTKRVFFIANKLVRNSDMIAYAHMGAYPPKDGAEFWYKSQIGGAASIVSKILNASHEFDTSTNG